MRVLLIPGFLSSSEDLRPISNSKDENTFVDVKNLVSKSTDFESLKDNFYNIYGSKSYDLAIGYSFGGRLLSRLQLKDVKKIYVSSNILNLTEEVLLKRKKASQIWVENFKKSLLGAKKEWGMLPLFSNHSMDKYRLKHGIATENWDEDEVTKYLENFFSIQEDARLNKNDVYVCGELDSKYSQIGEELKERVVVKVMSGLGHRCCYEDPQAFKKIIQGV